MKLQVLAVVVMLAGCVSTVPVVSDFNGDSVKINVDAFASPEQQKAIAQPEAERICKSAGKSRAEYASSVYNDYQYTVTMLYLCLG